MSAAAPPARPTIAITMGDPSGIGPEIIVKALSRGLGEGRGAGADAGARYVVFGCSAALHEAAFKAGVTPFWWTVDRDSDLLETTLVHDVVLLDFDHRGEFAPPVHPGPSREGGAFSFAFVEAAIAAAIAPADDPRHADAIVTGPISKVSWKLAGKGRFPGHTELLADRFRVRRSAMMFDSPKLRVVLATTHLALMEVRNVLTIGRVFDAIDLGAEGCRRLGVARPRIGVCGLNPHAGEEGLFGDEEARLIAPAIKLAREQGCDVSGPHPADTLFIAAAAGRHDLVVAMYHDQGLIPVKLLGWDTAVNLTLGLPAVRTSPDHGTAFDIAGRNRADASSMARAITLARTMAGAGVHTARPAR